MTLAHALGDLIASAIVYYCLLYTLIGTLRTLLFGRVCRCRLCRAHARRQRLAAHRERMSPAPPSGAEPEDVPGSGPWPRS